MRVACRRQEEWDRFMRFMKRFAEANDLGFASAVGDGEQDSTRQQMTAKTRQLDEILRILVPGALNHTKKIR